MRSSQIRCSRSGRSRARRGMDWLCLLGLALLCLANGCVPPVPHPAAGLRALPLFMVGPRTPVTPEADSLQPTLRWEAFPRPEDLKVDTQSRLVAARNTTYELRIWRAEDDFPAELVYERSGLAEPAHRVEGPLAPGTLYLWTVRARFELNGEPRITEWSVLIWPGLWDGREKTIPPRHRRDSYKGFAGYYPLKTPER